jgi:DNA (cytosine-5)-methyltransferase 1
VSSQAFPDVDDVDWKEVFAGTEIDLLIEGSPCQDLSCAGKREGLRGSRSGLFYRFADALKVLRPKVVRV